MDVSRCTSCRNRIKSHHPRTQNPRNGDWFHEDCWESTQGAIQQDYARRIGADGLEGLLSPYVCTSLSAHPFVPEQRTDEVADPAEIAEVAQVAEVVEIADALEESRVVLEDGRVAFALPA